MTRRFLPLLIFAGVLILLAIGLTLNPRELPSALIGKPVPEFTLPALAHDQPAVNASDFKGQVWVMNVWASWCVACQDEHDLLLSWRLPEGVALVGLNYKDHPKAARDWLRDMGGDPYTAVAVDTEGKTGIDLGIYGVPETFVIGRDGKILLRHTGALSQQSMLAKVMPAVNEALKP
ncbi:DsbE family thiol:disulfide interchange protein [Achromobacter sp. F4_2707]|uniref:DsbE family thiol:disulfide interchange protein n=1 Tax=Achromobacter sp. F4_2707 TaxID=3114286 RepID=UPI0039C635C9